MRGAMLISIVLLLIGCTHFVNYQIAEGVILDTGSTRSSIDYMPDGAEVLYYVNTVTADGESVRPVIRYLVDYANCSIWLEVSVRQSNKALSRVLLGRDFISACNLSVHISPEPIYRGN